MSTLEEKIFDQLSADTAIAAAVSTRIYPVIAPQNAAYPHVTYQRISGGQVNSLDGYGGTENPRIQIDCWAETYAAAKSLAKAVMDSMLEATAFTALMISDQDLSELDQPIYRVSMDFSCWHQE